MKNNFKHTEAQQLVVQSRFSQLVNKKIAEHNTTPMQLSLAMGQNRSYLYRQLVHNNQSVALILTLSRHLQTNLFEPYINLLPEELRITQRERDLQAQIAALQQQLTDLAKERDIYKSIAVK